MSITVIVDWKGIGVDFVLKAGVKMNVWAIINTTDKIEIVFVDDHQSTITYLKTVVLSGLLPLWVGI